MTDLRDNYEFTCYRESGHTTLSFKALTINEVVENLGDFLRGCGFHFNGSIQIVKEEEADGN
jgi:hypothetical protein